MNAAQPKKEQGPGVPEAIPRTVQNLGIECGAESLDRIWIFPPMITGRRERGLVTAARTGEDTDDDRLILVTASYLAERTGKGLTLEVAIDDQGIAPPESFPRVMAGVVRRAGEELGDAREVEMDGTVERFHQVLEELGWELLDPALPPLFVEAQEDQAEEEDVEVPVAPEPDILGDLAAPEFS